MQRKLSTFIVQKNDGKILSPDLEGVEEMSEVVLRSITRVSREKVRKKFVEYNERAERIDLMKRKKEILISINFFSLINVLTNKKRKVGSILK